MGEYTYSYFDGKGVAYRTIHTKDTIDLVVNLTPNWKRSEENKDDLKENSEKSE